MSVRTNAKGASLVDTTWPDGQRTRVKMADRTTAERINKKIEVAIVDEDRIWMKLRRELRLERNHVYTFADLVTRYLDEYVSVVNQDVRHKRARLGAFMERFGDYSLERINIQEVSRFLSLKKKEGVSNPTVNRYREVIMHLTHWAADQGIIEVDPLAKLKRWEEPEYMPARPEERLIDAIFAKIPPQVLPIYVFLRETGARKGEAIRLRPDQIDLSRQVVTFYTDSRRGMRTKNGKSRRVPLTADAINAVEAMPRIGSTVFYNPDTFEPWRERTLDKYWDAARKLAEVNNVDEREQCRSLRTHDLRHAYAIALAEEGCEMHFISGVLGHHSASFTEQRYARFSPDSASRRVLRVLEGRKASRLADGTNGHQVG